MVKQRIRCACCKRTKSFKTTMYLVRVEAGTAYVCLSCYNKYHSTGYSIISDRQIEESYMRPVLRNDTQPTLSIFD